MMMVLDDGSIRLQGFAYLGVLAGSSEHEEGSDLLIIDRCVDANSEYDTARRFGMTVVDMQRARRFFSYVSAV